MSLRLRFDSLNAIRGLAALFIAAVHFPADFFGADFEPLRNSYLLTNLFFALSGFIIMAAYGERLGDFGKLAEFIKGRVYRLVPLHLVTCVVILAVPYVAYAFHLAVTWGVTGAYAGDIPNFQNNWTYFMVHVLMLQGFGLLPELVYNFPAWSMGAIFFCSILLGVLSLRAVRPFRLPLMMLIFAGSYAVIAMYSPYFMGTSYDYGIFRGLTSFFSGALLFSAWQTWAPGPVQTRWWPLVQSTVVVLVLWYMTWVPVNSSFSLLAPLVWVPFIWVFSKDTGDFAIFLKHKWFKWLSDRSYSIFMNQAALLFIGVEAKAWTDSLAIAPFTSKLVGTMALLAYFSLLLIISNWTYKHIELRFQLKKKGSQTVSQDLLKPAHPRARDIGTAR